MSEMEELLLGLAKEVGLWTHKDHKALEKLLRESGLLRLLEAGMDLRNRAERARKLLQEYGGTKGHWGMLDPFNYDEALAALKEQLHG